MSSKRSMQTLAGLSISRGLASGPAFIFRGEGEVPVSEYSIESGHEEGECLRLQHALNDTKRDLDGLIAILRERAGHEDVKVFECHQMIVDDPMLLGKAERIIRVEHLNAETAVRRTAREARRQFERMNDPYFRERVRDLDDVERRLLKCLTGFSRNPAEELKVPSIIVADDLSPSETVQLPRALVLGFALNGGSTTSHVALLARAMGIPAVAGLGHVTECAEPGEIILLDGTNGAVTVVPDEQTIRTFDTLVARQRDVSNETRLAKPAGTLKDGSVVRMLANVHPGVPVCGLKEYGASGVGLYRSEYLWINREREPTEEEQFESYCSAAKFVATLGDDAALTIRALDIGGDKLVRGISTKENNPFLGNRSIRYLLSHRDVMRTQLRAILRASAFGKVKLMYPMISCIEEWTAATETLIEVKHSLDEQGIAYDKNLPVGIMVEIPAAAVNAEAFARHADFFSIGTNDLIQYTMAADRGNDAVANLYQPTNPAVLQLIRLTIAAAKKHHIPVSVCGECAADPVVGILLVAYGVDALSMPAAYIPETARILATLSRHDLDDYASVMKTVAEDATAVQIYAAHAHWLETHAGVTVSSTLMPMLANQTV